MRFRKIALQVDLRFVNNIMLFTFLWRWILFPFCVCLVPFLFFSVSFDIRLIHFSTWASILLFFLFWVFWISVLALCRRNIRWREVPTLRYPLIVSDCWCLLDFVIVWQRSSETFGVVQSGGGIRTSDRGSYELRFSSASRKVWFSSNFTMNFICCWDCSGIYLVISSYVSKSRRYTESISRISNSSMIEVYPSVLPVFVCTNSPCICGTFFSLKV